MHFSYAMASLTHSRVLLDFGVTHLASCTASRNEWWLDTFKKSFYKKYKEFTSSGRVVLAIVVWFHRISGDGQ